MMIYQIGKIQSNLETSWKKKKNGDHSIKNKEHTKIVN